jgi:hypothetical protein
MLYSGLERTWEKTSLFQSVGVLSKYRQSIFALSTLLTTGKWDRCPDIENGFQIQGVINCYSVS